MSSVLGDLALACRVSCVSVFNMLYGSLVLPTGDHGTPGDADNPLRLYSTPSPLRAVRPLWPGAPKTILYNGTASSTLNGSCVELHTLTQECAWHEGHKTRSQAGLLEPLCELPCAAHVLLETQQGRSLFSQTAPPKVYVVVWTRVGNRVGAHACMPSCHRPRRRLATWQRPRV